jgi:hypothetical protein
MDSPKLERAALYLAGKDNHFAIRREDRIDNLTRIVVCQLAQEFAILAIEKEMGMACPFGLQVSDRDDDFRGSMDARGGTRENSDG